MIAESTCSDFSSRNQFMAAHCMLRCDQDKTGTAVGRRGVWPVGLFPLYWPLLEPAGALEILACRIVLSLVVVALLLPARRELRGLRAMDRGTVAPALRRRRRSSR